MGDSACVFQAGRTYASKTHGIQVYAQSEIHAAAMRFIRSPTVSMGCSVCLGDSPKARAVAGVDIGDIKALVLAKLIATISGRMSVFVGGMTANATAHMPIAVTLLLSISVRNIVMVTKTSSVAIGCSVGRCLDSADNNGGTTPV